MQLGLVKLGIIGAMLTTSISWAKPKAVYIHFDVNKTILMSDSVTKKDAEAVAAELISNLPELQLDWDGKGVQSYYDYVASTAKSQFPGNDETSRNQYRTKRSELLSHFFTDLKKKGTQKQQQIALGLKSVISARIVGVQKAFGLFVESFLQANEKWQIDVKVLLRTFGNDLATVKPEILRLAGSHIVADGEFRQGQFVLDQMAHPREDFGWVLLRSNAKILTIQDDFELWKNDKKRSKSGKPMPLYDDILSIFFDDNIEAKGDKLGEVRDIVFPYLVASGGGILPKNLLGKNLVVADPLQVILDEDYFIKRYNECCDALGFSEMKLPL